MPRADPLAESQFDTPVRESSSRFGRARMPSKFLAVLGACEFIRPPPTAATPQRPHGSARQLLSPSGINLRTQWTTPSYGAGSIPSG